MFVNGLGYCGTRNLGREIYIIFIIFYVMYLGLGLTIIKGEAIGVHVVHMAFLRRFRVNFNRTFVCGRTVCELMAVTTVAHHSRFLCNMRWNLTVQLIGLGGLRMSTIYYLLITTGRCRTFIRIVDP